jgi:hypothetical protein
MKNIAFALDLCNFLWYPKIDEEELACSNNFSQISIIKEYRQARESVNILVIYLYNFRSELGSDRSTWVLSERARTNIWKILRR